MKFKKSLVIALVLCAPLSGCLKDSDTNIPNAGEAQRLDELPDAQAVIDHIGREVILESYKDLDAKVIALHQACQRLASERSAAALSAAQQAWKEARIPWESTESFLIGPVDSLGIDPHLDIWPLAVRDLEDVLEANPSITEAQVRALDDNVQGFHTAEFLLFGDGVADNSKDISELLARPSEFAYLVAVSGVMKGYTGELLHAWSVSHDPEDASSPAFIDIFTLKSTAQLTGFTSRAQVLQTIIAGGIQGIAIEVGTGKLATPLGANLASADASQVESQFSWNSLTDFQNNVESMTRLYTGDFKKEGPGIDTLVAQIDPALDAEIKLELDRAKRMIADIAGSGNLPFTRAIFDPSGRARTEAAIEQMAKLEAIVRDRLLELAR